jgi:hypothetical protein
MGFPYVTIYPKIIYPTIFVRTSLTNHPSLGSCGTLAVLLRYLVQFFPAFLQIVDRINGMEINTLSRIVLGSTLLAID